MDSLLIDQDFINSFFKFNPQLSSNISQKPHFFYQNQNQTFDFNDEQVCNFTKKPDDQIIPDFPDDCLKFISDILLEEDLDENPFLNQDFTSLQVEATEKSLYDVLNLNDNQSSGSGSGLGSGSSSPVSTLTSHVLAKKTRNRVKKTRPRDKNNPHTRNKVQATSNEDYVEMEQFDDVILLCNYKDKPENKNRGSKPNKPTIEFDLITNLVQCAQAVSSYDPRNASDLLKQIRQFASPYGDSVQRLAHHASNALEARLAGTGSTISTNLIDVRISVSDFLKAYRLYVSAIPFKRVFYFLANCTIGKLVENATKIHIIDFGIFLGLQWPCLIQYLSKRPNGPPKIRITGIEYPQQGFRPAERVEATGRRLSGYCKRFGVPFEYKAIAQKWESIKVEDFVSESDEVVIVNCMGRSGTLLDETIDQSNSQKDGFLKLVKDLKPDLFIHGVKNGTFNAPFFVTRFRETLLHYLSIFDVFDATIPRENHERLLVENEIYGKEIYNVIACEGGERVQRPESYKSWQVRSGRAGLRQVCLDKELVSQAKSTVKSHYHKEFVVDEDRDWMLQGWKGKTICALSFWKPC